MIQCRWSFFWGISRSAIHFQLACSSFYHWGFYTFYILTLCQRDNWLMSSSTVYSVDCFFCYEKDFLFNVYFFLQTPCLFQCLEAFLPCFAWWFQSLKLHTSSFFVTSYVTTNKTWRCCFFPSVTYLPSTIDGKH